MAKAKTINYTLQPCPFCGCTDHLEFHPLDKAVMVRYYPRVVCTFCGVSLEYNAAFPDAYPIRQIEDYAQNPTTTIETEKSVKALFKTLNEEVIAMWNQRNGRGTVPPKEISL